MLHSPSKMIGGVLGLAGFIAACITGIAAGADPVDTLWRALAALAICVGVGSVIGRIGMVPVRESIDAHIDANPMPEDIIARAPPAEESSFEAPGQAPSAQPAQAA